MERVLPVMLEDNDGWPRRGYCQLTQDGAEQAGRVLADGASAQAKHRSSLGAAQVGVRGVPL